MFFRRAQHRHAALMRELKDIRTEIMTLEGIMADKFDDLRAAVAAEHTVAASAVALIQGLASKIEAASDANDKDALAGIVADLRASQTDLAKAVTDNTGLSLSQSAVVSGPLPESAAVVDAHPANGGSGSGPLDNVDAPIAPTDLNKGLGAGDGAAATETGDQQQAKQEEPAAS